MNALDLAIIAVVALSAIFAFARGFVREALSIIAWIGAAAATIYGFDAVYAIALRFVTTPLLADVIAGAGLFLGSLIVLTILTSLIARSVQASRLSSIDRTLGLFFGIARGLVLVSLAFLLLDISVPPPDRPVWVREAKSAPLLQEGAAMLLRILPAQLQLKSSAALDSAKRGIEQAKEADRAMRALSSPAVPLPPPASAGQGPAYGQKEQQQLDRLIHTESGR